MSSRLFAIQMHSGGVCLPPERVAGGKWRPLGEIRHRWAAWGLRMHAWAGVGTDGGAGTAWQP